MAVHSKWSDGDLIFYDGTQEIFRIKDDTGGVVIGEDDEGVDFKIYGDTTGAYVEFDESADLLNFNNIKVTNQAPTTVATTGGIVTTTLTASSNRFQFVDTTGATNLVLPSTTGATALGIQYFIANTSTGSNDITVYDASTGGDLIGIIGQYESGMFVSNGALWRGIVATST